MRLENISGSTYTCAYRINEKESFFRVFDIYPNEDGDDENRFTVAEAISWYCPADDGDIHNFLENVNTNSYIDNYARINIFLQTYIEKGYKLVWFENEEELSKNIETLKVNELGIAYFNGVTEFVISYINNSMDGTFADYFLEEFGCNEYEEIVDHHGLLLSDDGGIECIIGDDICEVAITPSELFKKILETPDDDASQIALIKYVIYDCVDY